LGKQVDSITGENRILITPGANACLLPPILINRLLLPPSLIIMQLESPLPTILDIISRYGQNNHSPIPILLNPAPAPATPLPAWIYPHIYTLVLNETEATTLSGVDISDPSHESTEAVTSRAFTAAEFFISLGCPNVIITLGASGAIYLCSHPSSTSIRPAGREVYPRIRKAHVPAAPIPTPQGEVVDTTAAGDTFIGALAVSLVQSWAEIDASASDEQGNRTRSPAAGIEALDKGVRFAVRAAAWTVARKGTWDAMPRREDL
jgi:ribokinase